MNSSLDTSPALPVPPGQQSNFVNPPSNQLAIIVGLSVCLATSTFSAMLHCYAQWSMFKTLTWIDFWMVFGWAFHVAFVAFLYACLPYGAGRHQWDVTKSNFNQIEFFLFIDFAMYDFAILGPKISILLQLKDIFAPHGRTSIVAISWFFWAAAFLIAVNVVFYVALSFAVIFQCNPVAKGWNPNIPGQCLSQDWLLESSGTFNIVSDFLIFMLPLSAVWRLQQPLKKRLGVGSVFAVGFFGCICSAVRLYYTNLLDTTGDATSVIFRNQLWANAEITTALLIANIIIVPFYIRHQRGVSSCLDYSDQTSSQCNAISSSRGPQQSLKFLQRLPPGDPYIDLTSSISSIQKNDGAFGLSGKGTAEGSSAQGIMRTVQIETTESAGMCGNQPPATGRRSREHRQQDTFV